MTLAGPNPPKWPVAYHVQQTSICASVSVFCPPDYNTTFITSQSYMDSTAQRAGAGDVNDWLSPSPFVSDQTFIYMWNETTLATDIYSLARGASNVTCSRTLLPGAWPPSNFLQPQDFCGLVNWTTLENVLCWNASAFGMWYSSPDTNEFVGFQT